MDNELGDRRRIGTLELLDDHQLHAFQTELGWALNALQSVKVDRVQLESGPASLGWLAQELTPDYQITGEGDTEGLIRMLRAQTVRISGTLDWALKHRIAARAFGLKEAYWPSGEGEDTTTQDFFVRAASLLGTALENPTASKTELDTLTAELEKFHQTIDQFYHNQGGNF